MARRRISCLLLSLATLIPAAQANAYSKQCSLLGSRPIPVVYNTASGEYYLSDNGQDEIPSIEDILAEDGGDRLLSLRGSQQPQTRVYSSKEDLFDSLGSADLNTDASVDAGGRRPIKFHQHRSAQEYEEEEIVNEWHVWGRADVDYDQQHSEQQTLISLNARLCPCAPQERTFCLAQPHVPQNTCGIPRDSRLPVGCYNLTNRIVFIRNAWPVVVLWYGALFIFLVVTENGKSARNWVLAKMCPGRNQRLADAYLQREIVIRDRLRRVRLGRGGTVTSFDEEEGGGLAAADTQRIRTQTLVLKTKRFNAQREKEKRRRRRREQRLTRVEESDASTDSAPRTPERLGLSLTENGEDEMNTPETTALDYSLQSPMSFPPDGPLTTSASADSFQDNEIPQSMSADQATMFCAPCSPITPVAEESGESDDDDDELDFTCTICIMEVEDGEKVGALSCHHIFHVQCLKEWIKRKNACPLCQEPDIASPRPGNPEASPPPSPWRAPSPIPDASGEGTNTTGNTMTESDNINTTSTASRRSRGLRPLPNRPPLVRRTTLESVRSRLFEHSGSRSVISRDSSGNLVVLSAQSSTVSGPPHPQQSQLEGEDELDRNTVLSGNADDAAFQRRRRQNRSSQQQSRASETAEDS